MAAGDSLRQDLQADATNKALALEGVQVAAAPVRVPVVASNATRKPAVMTAIHRSAITANDAAGSIATALTAVTALNVGNWRDVVAHIRSATAGASISVALVLYDGAGTIMGMTSFQQLTCDSSNTDGTKYPSPIAIYDVAGATTVKALVRGISSGSPSIDLYLELA